MLLDRASELSAKIALYAQLKSTAEEAAYFETRASQFDNVAVNLQTTRERIAKLREAKVPMQFLPKEGATLLERTRALRTAVRSSPHSLADPPFDLKYAFMDRLRAIHDAAERAMLEAWRVY